MQVVIDLAGLVGGCDMSVLGDLSTCVSHDDDNNGLWTSVVVAAEAFRFAATGDPRAYDRAMHYYNGIVMLNKITGVPGLMARSAVPPGDTHGGGQWHFSTVADYQGWQWKGVCVCYQRWLTLSPGYKQRRGCGPHVLPDCHGACHVSIRARA